MTWDTDRETAAEALADIRNLRGAHPKSYLVSGDYHDDDDNLTRYGFVLYEDDDAGNSTTLGVWTLAPETKDTELKPIRALLR